VGTIFSQFGCHGNILQPIQNSVSIINSEKNISNAGEQGQKVKGENVKKTPIWGNAPTKHI